MAVYELLYNSHADGETAEVALFSTRELYHAANAIGSQVQNGAPLAPPTTCVFLNLISTRSPLVPSIATLLPSHSQVEESPPGLPLGNPKK